MFYIVPAAAALCSSVIWHILKIYIDPYIMEEGTLSNGYIGFLVLVYVLYCSFLFVKVWERWSKVENVYKMDVEPVSSIELSLPRIPQKLLSIKTILSLFVLGSFFLTHFPNRFIGGFTIFIVTYVIVLFGSVIKELNEQVSDILRSFLQNE